MSAWKRLVFGAAYLAFFAHDWIRLGPQIYVVASRADHRAASAPQR